MDKNQMLQAFRELDSLLEVPTRTRIIIGGGAAMATAHAIPISTEDVDGVPDRTSLELYQFRGKIAEVGRNLGISQVWLNDYFSTFLFVLPRNYDERLVPLFKGKNLEVAALGREDLILMKCFAGRDKDIPHARALLKKGADLKIVDARLQELLEKKVPGAQKAADFFDDLCEELRVAP